MKLRLHRGLFLFFRFSDLPYCQYTTKPEVLTNLYISDSIQKEFSKEVKMEDSLKYYSDIDKIILKKPYIPFLGICLLILLFVILFIPLYTTTGQIIDLKFVYGLFQTFFNSLYTTTDPRIVHIICQIFWINFLWLYTDVKNAKLVIVLILLGAFVPMFFIL
jgi:hypothetical protein